MNRFLLAMAALVIFAASAHAGPFRRTTTTTRASTCVGGNCSSASSRTVTRGAAPKATPRRWRLRARWFTPRATAAPTRVSGSADRPRRPSGRAVTTGRGCARRGHGSRGGTAGGMPASGTASVDRSDANSSRAVWLLGKNPALPGMRVRSPLGVLFDFARVAQLAEPLGRRFKSALARFVRNRGAFFLRMT
jgi:hypothetical protein